MTKREQRMKSRINAAKLRKEARFLSFLKKRKPEIFDPIRHLDSFCCNPSDTEKFKEIVLNHVKKIKFAGRNFYCPETFRFDQNVWSCSFISNHVFTEEFIRRL